MAACWSATCSPITRDLFGAIVCQVPLLDMQRYTKLSAGYSWIAEYGDPDVAEDWAFIQTFSPYHNLREGVTYPPVLFYTATSDDRVGPVQARKMAARMQARGHSGCAVVREPRGWPWRRGGQRPARAHAGNGLRIPSPAPRLTDPAAREEHGMTRNPVRQRLREGGVALGTMAFEFNTTGLGRIAANAGAEFVIYDMEHSGWGIETIRMLMATTRPTAAVPMVRVAAAQSPLIAAPSTPAPWA